VSEHGWERGCFVCLSVEGSRIAFGFDLAAAVAADLGVEIETVFVVPAATLTAISVGPSQESEHVEVREAAS